MVVGLLTCPVTYVSWPIVHMSGGHDGYYSLLTYGSLPQQSIMQENTQRRVF
jgi:hypothetical protein